MKINDMTLKKDEQAIFCLRELYEKHGYTQYKMSKFEEYDLYVRNKSFLISDSVITFTDTNGKLMALKPDVTLSIVKNSKNAPGCVQKLYYDEHVYRISGRSSSYQEITQVGLECLGDIDAYCIGEVLSLAEASLAQIGEDYILDVSHMGMLSYVIDRIGISAAGRQSLLECVAQKNLHDAEQICRAEGICDERATLLTRLSLVGGAPTSALQKLEKLFADEQWHALVQEFGEVLSLLSTQNVRVDFSVINDMNYYNGIVFQGFIKGVPSNILSGGQYDNLMQRMEKNAGAIGFAVYLDRLEALLEPRRDYDVDTLLLYDASVDAATVAREVQRITAEGLSVTAQKAIPEKITYRRLIKLTESGVQTLETNA